MSSMRRPRRPRRVPGVETRWRGGRWTHRVRWTDPVTGERRSEEFDELDDAVDFRAELRRARRSGRMGDLTAGREVLREFVSQEWWPTHAVVQLERATLLSYSSVWSKHLDPRVGHLQLREIDPGVVAKLRLAMEEDGVGAPTIVKAMTMLQSIFSTAVVWGRARANPVAVVRKPIVSARAVEPLAPLAVEQVAAQDVLDELGRVLVYLVAYAGLRPEEALALRWRHVRRGGTLLVEQKNVDGEILSYLKVRSKPPRSVDLLRPLQQELAAWRLSLGRPHDAAFVLARPDGRPWRASDFRNWRRRRWQEACHAAGLGEITITRRSGLPTRRTYRGPTPYWLRHSFASLLLHEGRLSPAELAEQLGHSIQTLLKTYSHVMADLKGQPRVPAEQQIAEARAERALVEADTRGPHPGAGQGGCALRRRDRPHQARGGGERMSTMPTSPAMVELAPVDLELAIDAMRELASEKLVRSHTDATIATARTLTSAADRIARAAAAPSPTGDREVRELLCQRCDREYETWCAPNTLWNQVIRDHGGDGYGDEPLRDRFICPSCFARLAAERGISGPWVLVLERMLSDGKRAEFSANPYETSSGDREREVLPPRVRALLADVAAGHGAHARQEAHRLLARYSAASSPSPAGGLEADAEVHLVVHGPDQLAVLRQRVGDFAGGQPVDAILVLTPASTNGPALARVRRVLAAPTGGEGDDARCLLERIHHDRAWRCPVCHPAPASSAGEGSGDAS